MNHLMSLRMNKRLVTVALAPESICALGESESGGIDVGGGAEAEVLSVGAVSSEETESESESK